MCFHTLDAPHKLTGPASMTEDVGFADLMRRVRAGDEQAANELVRQYEPEIRREVRLRLSSPQVRRAFDSMDICQSVLASFFVRAHLGQYEVNEPRQLFKLLMAMARNKLAFQVRRERAQRRDHRRVVKETPDELEVATGSATPSQVVEARELVNEFRRRLSTEERYMADLRSQGHSWERIAAAVGGSPEARRKQLARAIERISQELGLESPRED